MYTFSFEIAAFVLALFGILYSLTVRRRQYHPPKGLMAKLQSQHFVFLLMLLSILLSAASSVGGVYLQGLATDETAPWQYLLHALYFFFHTALSAAFALYIMNVNGTSIARGRRFWTLFFLPVVLSELLVLSNVWTGAAFYMDEAHVYHRGALMPLLYASGALYIVMGFVAFFRHKKAISRGDSVAIGVVIIMATLGIVVQALRSDLLVELFFEAMAFLVLLVLLEERSGHIDPVTGALNRKAFVDSNRRLMQTGQHYGIVWVTLTNLELFSSMFRGREMEELLMQVSTWLGAMSSEQDLYYYREGRFAILSRDPGRDAAQHMAEAILERFGSDWYSGGMTLRLDAAVSAVRVPEEIADLSQLEELLSCTVRTEGAGSHLIPFVEVAAVQRDRAMEAALRRAIEEGRLRVWYQPIWSAGEKRTVAAEALLRVDDPMLRSVSPEIYIPIAEKSGMIREIGLFVFEDVCRFLRDNTLLQTGLSYIELNLSVYQFLYDDLAERFEEIRSRYGVDAHRINLEVTETASFRAAGVVSEAMERLRALGYSFSLDDFGTGYSNLHRVIHGAYANIKIDKSLLWDAEKNARSAGLLDGLTATIRRLGYHVVQEGVETKAQLERVTACGCDLIQGYLFSPPVQEDAFLQYLAAERAAGN